MSYDEYWRGSAELPMYYRKAQELKIERENARDWRLGLYVRDAILACVPFPVGFAKGGSRPRPYPEVPYPVTKRQDIEQQQEMEKARYDRIRSKMLAKMKAQKGGEASADRD